MAHRRLGRIVPRDADQQEDAAAEIPAGDARPGTSLRTAPRRPTGQRTLRSGSATAASSTRPTGTTARTPSRPRTSPRPTALAAAGSSACEPARLGLGRPGQRRGGTRGRRARRLPAASTIKLFVASAFWRSAFDPGELVAHVPPAGSAGVSGVSLGRVAAHAGRSRAADARGLRQRGHERPARPARLRRGQRGDRQARPRADGRPAADDDPWPRERDLRARSRPRPGSDPLLLDEARIAAALELALDSEPSSRYHLPAGVQVAAKTGELESVFNEVALLDDGARRLVTAVCSSPPARPDEVPARGAALWHRVPTAEADARLNLWKNRAHQGSPDEKRCTQCNEESFCACSPRSSLSPVLRSPRAHAAATTTRPAAEPRHPAARAAGRSSSRVPPTRSRSTAPWSRTASRSG